MPNALPHLYLHATTEVAHLRRDDLSLPEEAQAVLRVAQRAQDRLAQAWERPEALRRLLEALTRELEEAPDTTTASILRQARIAAEGQLRGLHTLGRT